ncbi:MAG: MFS transporter, partial [Candidatus Aenigmatarchaeota archaeon]
MEEDKPKLDEETRQKSLKYSTLDGAFCAMKVGIGESFFSAFAIFLKATTFQIGLLGSLPQAIGSFLQLFTTRLIKLFGSRKKFVCISAAFEILMYALIALAFYFGKMRVYWLLFFICLYWVFGIILGPAWSSWMGDLVKENERGKYFGRRNEIIGFALLIAYLAGGYILQQFNHGSHNEYWGFVTIFVLASAFRLLSIYYLARQHEPEYHGEHTSIKGFICTIKDASMKNYGFLVGYLVFMNFAVYLSAPFFAAYMLYDLKYDYLTFTIVNASLIAVKYLFMPVWGRLADRYGTK